MAIIIAGERSGVGRQDAGTARNGLPLFPIQPGANVVTLELVNQLPDEAP